MSCDDFDFQAKALGHRCSTFEFLESFLIRCNTDRTVLLETGGLPGFGFESCKQLTRVLGEHGHVSGRTQLSHQTCCMPCGAAGQFLPFQKKHIGPAQFGQMIGNAAADHTTTDDYDLGLFWKFQIRHCLVI